MKDGKWMITIFACITWVAFMSGYDFAPGANGFIYSFSVVMCECLYLIARHIDWGMP